jgi:hypothetical protein
MLLTCIPFIHIGPHCQSLASVRRAHSASTTWRRCPPLSIYESKCFERLPHIHKCIHINILCYLQIINVSPSDLAASHSRQYAMHTPLNIIIRSPSAWRRCPPSSIYESKYFERLPHKYKPLKHSKLNDELLVVRLLNFVGV